MEIFAAVLTLRQEKKDPDIFFSESFCKLRLFLWGVAGDCVVQQLLIWSAGNFILRHIRNID